MADRGLHEAHGRPRRGASRLLLALAVSLLAHAILLGVLKLPKPQVARAPKFAVSLVATIVDAPRAEASRTPAAAAAPDPEPRPTQVPQPAPPRADAPRAAARVKPPSQAPANAAAASAPGPERPDLFQPATELADPPGLEDNPAADLGLRELGSRRLQAEIWVSADGTVARALVSRYELSDEAADRLQAAVMGMRFRPATSNGQPVGAWVKTRLCFDAVGRFSPLDKACLRSFVVGAECGASAACAVSPASPDLAPPLSAPER